jgi:signal transduction histidine kinase
MSSATPGASLRSLCHAMSQPLTAARGSLELALTLPEGDPTRSELLADAQAAIERLMELTAQLRDLADQFPAKS